MSTYNLDWNINMGLRRWLVIRLLGLINGQKITQARKRHDTERATKIISECINIVLHFCFNDKQKRMIDVLLERGKNRLNDEISKVFDRGWGPTDDGSIHEGLNEVIRYIDRLTISLSDDSIGGRKSSTLRK